MFGSTIAAPPEEKKLAGIDADQVATNQQAIPVPYVIGRRRVALHYIAPVYNKRVEEVVIKTGKDAESTVGFVYFGDIAATICCVGRRVPLKKIYRIIIEQQVVWESTNGLTIGNPYSPITITGYGAGRLYAGRFDQPADTMVLTPVSTTPPDPVVYPDFNPRKTNTWPDGDETEHLP